MSTISQDATQLQMEKFCERILNMNDVHFAGLISNMGNLYAGGFRSGFEPKKDDAKKQLMYMKFALESCLRRDFDDSLGEFQFSVIHRKNAQILTMNVCSYLLLVFMGTKCDANLLSKIIQEMLDDNYEYYVKTTDLT